MSPYTIADARAAKEEATHRFSQWPSVVGIGITRLNGGYGVKVNLSTPSQKLFPNDVNGVPLLVEVTGQPYAVYR